MKRIVLASGSPRRRELLNQVGILFDVVTADFDEMETVQKELVQMESKDYPKEVVKRLAYKKASLVCQTRGFNAVVIAADTIVWNEGVIYGKPKDAEEAFAMLNKLQGRSHQVYTGVCIMDKTVGEGKEICFADCTEVRMRCASEQEIRAYCRTGEPFDKAGAYAVQGKAACFVESIIGDYNTIVGLPLARVCLCLRELGFDIMECW